MLPWQSEMLSWWYIDMECDSLNYDLNPEDYEGKEDLSCPRVEVLAWKMIPRGCGMNES